LIKQGLAPYSNTWLWCSYMWIKCLSFQHRWWKPSRNSQGTPNSYL